MPKRKVKTYQQLIQENKEAIMGNPKLMNVIYDRIDRKHQKKSARAKQYIKRAGKALFFMTQTLQLPACVSRRHPSAGCEDRRAHHGNSAEAGWFVPGFWPRQFSSLYQQQTAQRL